VWIKELDIARRAAREAGEILLRKLGRINRISKKGEIDLVTEADLASEEAIVGIIREHFPRDSILTEESGEYRNRPDRVWLVDPLDGTTNFAHGFPFFALSLALEVKGDLVVGIVYNPRMNEFFEALKGGGAFLNGRPVHVSPTKTLNEALCATGFPYDIRERPKEILSRFREMIIRAQGLRRPGSAALDLCYVAAGIFDAFWEEGLKPWDTAAGALILNEAGGRTTDFKGRPFTPYMDTVAATNGLLHQEMLSALERGSDPLEIPG